MFSVTIRERSGQVYTFHFDKTEILIGRIKGNDVILPKQNISKHHAMIRAEGASFVVEDLGSTNGTFVNGHRITDPVEVTVNDKVYLGDFVIQFFPIAGEDPVASVAPAAASKGAPPSDDDDLAPLDPSILSSLGIEDPPAPDPPAELPRGAAAKQTHIGAGFSNPLAGLPIRLPPPVEPDDGDDPFAEFRSESLGGGQAVPEYDRRQSGMDLVDAAAGGSSGSSVIFDASRESTKAQLEDDAAAARRALDVDLLLMRPAVAATSPHSPGIDDLRSTSASPPWADRRTEQAAPVDLLWGDTPAHEAASAPPAETAAGAAAPDDVALAKHHPPSGAWAAVAEDPDHAVTSIASPAQVAAAVMAARRAQTGGYAAVPAAQPVGTTSRPTGPAPIHLSGHQDDLAMLYGRAMADLRAQLTGDVTTMSDDAWAALERAVGDLIDRARRAGELAPGVDIDGLRRDLVYELTWLGPLESLLDDAAVSRIEVDGFDRIAVVRAGARAISDVRFSCQAAWQAAVGRVVHAMGATTGHIGDQLDGVLADGTTVQLVWPPLAPSGPLLVLRKPVTGAMDLASLADQGWLASDLADQLAAAVAAGRSLAVVAPPCDARRQVVEALAAAAPAHERMAVLEADAPIAIDRAHLIRLAARRQGEGNGPISVAARLGADRVVAAGCDRALLAELVEIGCQGGPSLIASWTGWDAADATQRAAHAVLLSHPGLDRLIAFERVAMALDVVVVVQPGEGGEATISDVAEVAGANSEGVVLRPFEG